MNNTAGYDYASTQVNLTGPVAAKMQNLGRRIKSGDLARDGVEVTPHITVKYGLHTDDPEEIRALLESEKPIKVRLGKTSLFENDEHDVVKVDVDSEDLHRLNAKLKQLPNTETHPKYQPHATVAYVKPGLGKKYKDLTDLDGQEVLVDKIVFSMKNGRQIPIPLGGGELKKAACLVRIKLAVDSISVATDQPEAPSQIIPPQQPETLKQNVYDKATFDEAAKLWRLIDKNGYARLYPEKPAPHNFTRFTYEHRRAAEEMLGRALLLNEIVHHIDRNRSNNAKENLRTLADHLEHIRQEHPEWRTRKTLPTQTR
jgi:2'-5' RNA ligase